MEIPNVDIKSLIEDLQRGETMALTESDDSTPGSPITETMKEQLDDLANSFKVVSYDLAPDNEALKFSELLLLIKRSIY